MTFSFYRFFFFYFSDFPASLIAFFLFLLFFSLLCLPALLTVFLSPPFLIFLPYFPPHIHLQNQRKFITTLFHPPSLLIPFARAISFHIFRISTFLFLKKVYTYIYLISAIFCIVQRQIRIHRSSKITIPMKFIYPM